MKSTSLQRYRQRTLIRVLVVSGIAGAIYGGSLTYAMGHVPNYDMTMNVLRGLSRGIFTGLLVGGLIGGFEIFIINAGRGLRHLAFLPMILCKGALYAAFILGALWLGGILFAIDGDPGVGVNGVTGLTLGFSLLFTTIFAFIMEIAILLGPGVLPALVRGRYHQPRQEHRLIVFFDMRGSTAIAEQIGAIAFHRLLNRFFTDLTEPVLAWRGTVHKYVGDEMIVTWPLDGGGDPAGAFSAVVAAQAHFATLADQYRRDFGIVPAFRAILHAGEVVTGEMGEVKREIVLLGDTVNTTAKIEQVSKTLPDASIASAEALAVVPLPAGIQARPLGNFTLPGKSTAITLYAIT